MSIKLGFLPQIFYSGVFQFSEHLSILPLPTGNCVLKTNRFFLLLFLLLLQILIIRVAVVSLQDFIYGDFVMVSSSDEDWLAHYVLAVDPAKFSPPKSAKGGAIIV